MSMLPNSKILGAFTIGIALVALAYVTTNFGTPTGQFDPPPAALESMPAAARMAITVTDEDGNGVEDWRDDLITSEPISLDSTDTTTAYVAPTTLTGKLGVTFFERYLQSKTYSGIGENQNEIINDAITDLERSTSFPIYDVPDITIVENYTEADIVTYANAYEVDPYWSGFVVGALTIIPF